MFIALIVEIIREWSNCLSQIYYLASAATAWLEPPLHTLCGPLSLCVALLTLCGTVILGHLSSSHCPKSFFFSPLISGVLCMHLIFLYCFLFPKLFARLSFCKESDLTIVHTILLMSECITRINKGNFVVIMFVPSYLIDTHDNSNYTLSSSLLLSVSSVEGVGGGVTETVSLALLTCF